MSSVSDEIVRLQRLLHRIKAETVATGPAGADWTSYVLLHRLVERDMRAGELAECVHSDPSTVSRQLRPLVDAGLVERRPDPADGRAQVLVPTEAGRALQARMAEGRRRFFDTVLDGWTDADKDALTTLLRRFTDDLETARVRLTTTQGVPA